MQLLSFDIEISDEFDLEEGEDMEKYAPLHVAVASTAVHGGEERVWYSKGEDAQPLVNMTRPKARELLRYLRGMQENGYMVCAWNGLGFDLRWLGYAAEDSKLAGKVAMDLYDPMFQFFNQRGFPIGLASVGKAMNISQRKSMNAAEAPKRWRNGDHKVVMEYVLGDSRMANQIVAAIIERQGVLWVTRNGAVTREPMPTLKTVEAVLKDPEPDQSWMTTPIPRTRFHHWLPSQK
jgi:hypothetical protein